MSCYNADKREIRNVSVISFLNHSNKYASKNEKEVYSAPGGRIRRFMELKMNDKGSLVLFSGEEKESGQHVFIYKITSVCERVEEESESIYVAVPNGSRVKITDLPEGSYVLEQLN